MNPQDTYQQEKMAREKEKLAKEQMTKTKGVVKQVAIWGSVIVVLALVVWGIVILVKNYEPPKNSADLELVIDNKIEATDWVKGNRNAKVILTEYSDFQCPACGQYFPLLQNLVGQFGNDIAFVYRHFPLPMHPHSKTMAMAAEAAGKQNKFWEMHDLIFANQTKWTNRTEVKSVVKEYATQLKLDVAKFERDMDSKEIKDKVNAALPEADRIGLGFTPSFFLNGKLIKSPGSLNEFSTIITEALNEAKNSSETQ